MLIESVLLLLLQNCFSDHKKACNLEAYVDWFNRLSYLVATEICLVSNENETRFLLIKPLRWFAVEKRTLNFKGDHLKMLSDS